MFIYTGQLKDVAAEKSAQALQTHQCQIVLVVSWPICVPPPLLLLALAKVCSMGSPRENTSVTV